MPENAFSSVPAFKIFPGEHAPDPLETIKPILWVPPTHNRLLFMKLRLLKNLKKTLKCKHKICEWQQAASYLYTAYNVQSNFSLHIQYLHLEISIH